MTSKGKYSTIAHLNAALYTLYAKNRETKTAGQSYTAAFNEAKTWKVMGVVTNPSSKDGRFFNNQVRMLTTVVQGVTLIQNLWGGEVSQGDHLWLSVKKESLARYMTYYVGSGERVDVSLPDRAGVFEDIPQFHVTSTPHGRLPWAGNTFIFLPIGVVLQDQPEHRNKRALFTQPLKETQSPVTNSSVDSVLEVILTI